MGIMDWYNGKIKNLNVWDIGALKVCMLLIGMIIGAYAVGFVKSYLWTIIAIIVLLMIKLMLKVFKK